jgi:hypothetical protein
VLLLLRATVEVLLAALLLPFLAVEALLRLLRRLLLAVAGVRRRGAA